jgi:hypothetical protein
MAVVRDGRALALDLQPFGARGVSWTIRLARPESAARANVPCDVTLSWPNLRRVPGAVDLTLVDETTGMRRSLRHTSSYVCRLAAGEEARLITVTAAPVRERLSIVGLTAVPTRGGGVQIGYRLTGPAETTVLVRSLGGRAVATVEQQRSRAAGDQTLVWDGRDAQGRPVPHGIYSILVVATDAAMHQARATTVVRR